MADTYYKYAERAADSYVNWADVGKNMSDMLIETNRVREAKKAELDELSRKFQDKINLFPQGQDATAQKAALELADSSSKLMLIQDRLLKSGQLSLKDYTIFRQNLISGIENGYGALSDYQKNYGELMDRAKKDISSKGELKLMADVEGFGNWAKSGFYVNQMNGTVGAALKEEKVVDGKKVFVMSENPNNVASVGYLRNVINTKWDKYDVNAAISGWTNTLGKQITEEMKRSTLTKQGNITSVSDVLAKPEFKKAEDQFVIATLANDWNKASVLMDRVNFADVNGQQKEYYFTQDPTVAAKDNAAILKIIDPSTQGVSFKFNKYQTEQAEGFVRSQARAQYDKEVKVQALSQTQEIYHPPQEWQYKLANDKAKLTNISTRIGTLYAGANGAQIKSAGTGFRDINPNIQSVNRTPTGVDVYIRNAAGVVELRPISFYGGDGTLMTQDEFIMAAAPILAGEADWKSAINRGGRIKNGVFNSTASESSQTTPQGATSPTAASGGNAR